MALTAKNSPLVSGGISPSRAAPASTSVRLVRAICINGERVEVGTVLTLDRIAAVDLITAGKAERVTGPAAPVQTSAQGGDAKTSRKLPPAASPLQKDLNHVQQ